MKSIHRLFLAPWAVVTLFTAGVLISMIYASPLPLDDHFHYQRFIEALAAGNLDLSIPGFQGASILTVPWHWVSGSSISHIEFQAFCALLLPLLAFLAGRALYKSTWHGIVLSGIITLMPFISFLYLRGGTWSSYVALMLLTIWGAARGSKWTWIAWGFAMITKPFALALLPIIILFTPQDSTSWIRRHKTILLGLCIPLIYVAIQYLQAGHLIVGAHPDLNHANVWQGPERIFLNIAHAFQILFSIHNYYFPDPSLTGAGNMMHTTPVLIFLGLFGLLAPRGFFRSRALPIALLTGALIGLGMNALLDHMDHFYMQASVLLLILAALPVLKKYLLWIPLVLATLHFQWFYFFLQYRNPFSLELGFFTTPAILDILFLTWCITHYRKIKELLLTSLYH